jgi:DNA-directed RNA polymerase I, II, and III subunit RPABC4
MSREAYQPPPTGQAYNSAIGSTSQGGAGQSGYAGSPAGEGYTSGAVNTNIVYICGDCDSKVTLPRGGMIACTTCGHRVLYKERTKRYELFADTKTFVLTMT